jgi:hypothetical protein
LFNAIDVSNNLDLETLVLASNGLTTLNFENNTLLTNLNVSNNPITSLDVSFLSQLQTLSLYETQIEILDVSSLVGLITVSAYNGSLKAANFQNGGGNTDNVENLDISGNPDLECILVDSVAWAESPSGWIKDATASYTENISLNFTTFPGSTTVQSDGLGNQIEFNDWLIGNGGAVVTAECGSVIWTYEIFSATATSEEFESSIEYLVEFSASTPYTEPDITQASFTIENITGAGEDDGSGGDLCSAVSYDLSNLITVDLNAPNIDSFRFEQINVSPDTPGVPDATFNGTEVDFPDTGAGSFSYTFRLIVEKSIDVYNTTTGTYESELFTDESRLTVNNVKIPFNPGPDQEKAWCPGTTLPTLAELYEEFEIIDGIEFESFDLTFTPENYWFDTDGGPITEVTGPGDYVFNANAFLPECGAIPATVTVVAGKSAGISTSFEICPASSLTEQDLIAALGADDGGTWVPSIVDPDNVDVGTYTYSHGACTIGEDSTVTISIEQELFAGNDVLDAEDQTSYRCGDTVSFDLNTFRDVSADPGGNWFDDSNNLVPNGITDFPDTGAGSFTRSFSYRQANDVCGFQPSEAFYDVTWNATGFNAGTSANIEICEGTILTEQDLIAALGADGGGTWVPVIDINNVSVGTYTYSHGNCSTTGDTTITVTEAPLCDYILNIKVFLQGAALNPNSGEENLMRDDLRVSGNLPSTAPYEDKISCDPTVFNNVGTDAIVDWVWVELREQTNNTIIVDSRSALLQRDGDVVAVDGASPLVFSIPTGNYYVSVNHRNHLGIMSSNAIALTSLPTIVDFSNGSVSTFGSNAQTATTLSSNALAMWAGDVNGDGVIQYAGAGVLDTTALLAFILNDNTNFLNIPTWAVNSYNDYDVDMSGSTQFAGAGLLDTPFILQNILSYQGNFLGLNTWQIVEQLPNNQ